MRSWRRVRPQPSRVLLQVRWPTIPIVFSETRKLAPLRDAGGQRADAHELVDGLRGERLGRLCTAARQRMGLRATLPARRALLWAPALRARCRRLPLRPAEGPLPRTNNRR